MLAIAKRNGWLVYHVPMATVRGSQGRGYPDLTLARDHVAYWFELKQDDGIVGTAQVRWAFALPEGAAFVIRPRDLEYVERLLA